MILLKALEVKINLRCPASVSQCVVSQDLWQWPNLCRQIHYLGNRLRRTHCTGIRCPLDYLSILTRWRNVFTPKVLKNPHVVWCRQSII